MDKANFSCIHFEDVCEYGADMRPVFLSLAVKNWNFPKESEHDVSSRNHNTRILCLAKRLTRTVRLSCKRLQVYFSPILVQF